jgi:VanZ family protein
MNRRLAAGLRWAPVIALSALIVYLSGQSHLPEVGPSFPERDKVIHGGVYAVWGLLFLFAARRQWPRLGLASGVALATLAAALFGLSDEFHQSFVPDRTADVFDLLADTVGGFCGALAYGLLCRRGSRPRTGELGTGNRK